MSVRWRSNVTSVEARPSAVERYRFGPRLIHGLDHLGVACPEHVVPGGDWIAAVPRHFSQSPRPRASFHQRHAGERAKADIPAFAQHDRAEDPCRPVSATIEQRAVIADIVDDRESVLAGALT